MHISGKITIFVSSLVITFGLVYFYNSSLYETQLMFVNRKPHLNMANIAMLWNQSAKFAENISNQEVKGDQGWDNAVDRSLVETSLDSPVASHINEMNLVESSSGVGSEHQLIELVANTRFAGTEDDSLGVQSKQLDNETNSKNNTKRWNVLFIISDDLRPQLNAYTGRANPNPYNATHMHTPNLDALSRRSLVLTSAYCQFSVCGPSRASFLTSRRPDTTNVWNLRTYWRNAGGNFTTLPQFYKNNGYITVGLGKIYHPGATSGYDDPISWNEPYYRPNDKHVKYWWRDDLSWVAASKDERLEHPLYDEQVTHQAIVNINKYASKALLGEQPFFMAVGYKKPHIPFICAEEAFQFYPLAKMEKVTNTFFPVDAPDIGWFHPEPGSYADNVQYNCSFHSNMCTLPEPAIQKIRRAYFACVTYIDGEVGKLLATLEENGLSDSTIVVFLGDHGYHLGENGLVGKHTDFEQSTHVPLMLHIPGQTDSGYISNAIVELVDLFPTIVDASGLGPMPACAVDSSNVSLCTEGISLLPLIRSPNIQFKQGAISQIVRRLSMGYSLRTTRFRYTEWTNFTIPGLSAEMIWSNITKSELYDHDIDPEENINYSMDQKYMKYKNDLRNMLHKLVNLEASMKQLDYFFSFMR